MKNLKKFLKFVFAAIVGAVLWTIFLTPYVLIVSNLTLEQYISWVIMEFSLVPVIAPIVFFLTEIGLKKAKLNE